jgi:NADP-dependent 3-hydroxy acid dehydrogenase YdfG
MTHPRGGPDDGAPLLVVLGAGPGLGTAVARRFGAAGYQVGLIGRREAALARTAEVLQAEAVPVRSAVADVADAPALTAALERLVRESGRVDVLHHNISTYRDATASATSAEDLLADLAIGTASLLTAVRAVLPAMLAAGTGTVLATGSGAADRPMAGAATLGVQKAALRNLVQALDAELRPRGVHAATLTVEGILRPGGPFDPARVADALYALAAETAGPADNWRTVVPYPG